MRESAPRRDEAEDEIAGHHARASPHQHQHPEHERVLDLQRRIGNREVAGMLTPVQRADRDPGQSVMDRDDEMELEAQYGKVISGHGRFNENHLAAQRRKKAGTFEVPEGMTVVMYAPPGASLDDRVANRIENANPPRADELELLDAKSKVVPMPAGYPWTFTQGRQVIDYTVRPPDGLRVEGSPITVTTPTPLRELVERAAADGHAKVHYACCSAGWSEHKDFESLFTHKGHYVRLKNPV